MWRKIKKNLNKTWCYSECTSRGPCRSGASHQAFPSAPRTTQASGHAGRGGIWRRLWLSLPGTGTLAALCWGALLSRETRVSPTRWLSSSDCTSLPICGLAPAFTASQPQPRAPPGAAQTFVTTVRLLRSESGIDRHLHASTVRRLQTWGWEWAGWREQVLVQV